MGFLLNPLGFLRPITTSLLLITYWVYWPLSQLNEFPNSFPGLPKPVYFLFTSYYYHGLTTLFIELPQPVYSLFTSFYSCRSAGHRSCHFSLLGLLPYSFTIFLSHLFYIVGLLPLLDTLSKISINK